MWGRILAAKDLPALAVGDHADLAGLGILGNVWVGVGRKHEDANYRPAGVGDRARTVRTPRQWHDVAFAQRPLAVFRPQVRLAAQHDEQFIAAVVEVEDVLRLVRLELPDRSAETGARAPEPTRARTAPIRNLI